MGEKNFEYSIFYEQTWQVPVNNGFHNTPTDLLRLITRKITFWDCLKKHLHIPFLMYNILSEAPPVIFCGWRWLQLV